jgi:hypothetical protein
MEAGEAYERWIEGAVGGRLEHPCGSFSCWVTAAPLLQLARAAVG